MNKQKEVIEKTSRQYEIEMEKEKDREELEETLKVILEKKQKKNASNKN